MIPVYEREAENFLTEVEREYYENGAGLKETFDLSPVYERYAHLFDFDRVKELLARRATKEERYLAHFAASQYLDRAVAPLTDEIMTAETQATVEWDGGTVSYRRSLSNVVTEPDRNRRRAFLRLIHVVTARQNELRAERLRGFYEAARQLGFPRYVEFCDEMLGIRLTWLRPQMDAFLARTAEAWRKMLARYLTLLGVPPEEGHIVDLRHALTAPQFESLFPEDCLLPLLHRTMHALGIDLAGLKNLHLDTEQRELKTHRPFCCPVRVPSDIRLVTSLRGGREHYNMLFHETGHALNAAFTNPAASFAYRCLGDYTVTETQAFLSNLLLTSPVFMREFAGIEAGDDYFDFSRFYQLYFLRRLGARLGYEQELHERGPDEGRGESYLQRVGGALGVEMSPEYFLADVDDGLYCTCYLRAWMLEVQLRRKLMAEFGERWFSRPEAGDFLREIWWTGRELTGEELAQRLGYPGLQIEPLIEDVLTPTAD